MKAMERIAQMRAELVDTQSKLKSANRVLALQASLDGLTGIANRREFDTQLQREYSRCQRENSSIGLLFCDIDFFKGYNDSYGHLAGDDCIKAIANLLERSQIRGSDLVARYGGEEFAILLPNTNEHGVRVLAHRLLEKINEANIEHNDSSVASHVTLSIGGTCCIRLNEITPVQLIDQADQALYVAKNNGRNNFQFYTPKSDS